MKRGTRSSTTGFGLLAAGLAAAGLTLTTACAGTAPGGDAASATSSVGHVAKQPATEDGLKAAVKAMAEALLASPSSTYDFLSAECRSKVTRADYTSQMVLAQGFLEAMSKTKLADMRTGAVTVRNVTATTGEGTVELLDASGKQVGDSSSYTTYVYEHGSWYNSECPNRGSDTTLPDSGSGSSGSDTTIGGDLPSAGEVAEKDRRAKSADGVVGTPSMLGPLSVDISSIAFGESFDDPTLSEPYNIKVAVRIENRTGSNHDLPELKVVCVDGTSGSWSSDGSFSAYGNLRAGTYASAELSLGVPRGCVDPIVRATESMFSDSALLDWPIPADALRG